MVKTPIMAPKANAFAERFIGTVRRERLDHLLVQGRRHLGQVLTEYVSHYNRARPHRLLGLDPPEAPTVSPGLDPTRLSRASRVLRRDVLGGLIHEYHLHAA